MAWPTTKDTKTTITALASTLCLAQHNTTSFSQFYDDAIDELGRRGNPPFIDQTWQQVTASTATYAYPSTALRLLYIFYDDTLLYPESDSSLTSYSEDWEADTGTPVSYTQDGVNARYYQLYPNPDATGDSTAAADWGTGFPENDLSIFYAEDRSTDIEDYYSIPIAFDCLAREFDYPSDHHDPVYSAICRQLADFFYKLAGVV